MQQSPDLSPITYGINVPSGRLVLANDLRHLVYTHNDPFLQNNEQTNRRIIHTYADVGLLYIFIQDTIDIHPTHQLDSYVIGSMPDDPLQYANYITTLPENHRPIHAHDAPLKRVGHRSPWIHAMDGDHVEQALHRFTPDDAARIRQTFTNIPVTPGYYALTLESSQDIEEQRSAVIARIDDGAERPAPTVTTFNISKAIAQLAGIPPHKFHHFDVSHRHHRWALGCPTIESTTNMYSASRNFAPIDHDIPSLAALYDQNPDVFAPHQLASRINMGYPIFAEIPHNIAPEAIACWIAGADATMHAIMYHPPNAKYPTVSQHTISHIYRDYQHFRAQLWGAAVAQGTTDAVVRYTEELRAAIQQRSPIT